MSADTPDLVIALTTWHLHPSMGGDELLVPRCLLLDAANEIQRLRRTLMDQAALVTLPTDWAIDKTGQFQQGGLASGYTFRPGEVDDLPENSAGWLYRSIPK